MDESTTLAATPAIIADYQGPCEVETASVWRRNAIVMESGRPVFAWGKNAHIAAIRLDLSPLPSGNPSPAFWHVGALVCRKVGLDPSGGFVLVQASAWWELRSSDGIVHFSEHPLRFFARSLNVTLPDLPTDPLAYPAALCAIARAVLEL